jgi:RHS repeat-associated protein
VAQLGSSPQESAAHIFAPTRASAPAASASTASPFAAPVVNLPRGGGALRGIGEKFSVGSTGTGSLSVPIAVSRGRSGFGPQLTLSYDSAAGSGPFGLGWTLSLPSITRKTDKGLPRYDDAAESDIYLLSGAEDLVPVTEAQSGRFEDTVSAPGYTIHRYRPRVEGLFARIERWTHDSGEIHWRSISRDNVTTWYGRNAASRIFDPADAKRVFSWLVCASCDDKGNAIVYEYAAEDSTGVDRSLANEANRSDAERAANRYLKRIRYGNRVPNRDANWKATDPASLAQWMFEVVFDYGDVQYAEVALDPSLSAAEQHHYVTAADAPGAGWPVRSDPWSQYRATFEVRSYRRCRRVLMFHRFPELPVQPCLVRSTEFDYDDFDYSAPYNAAQEAAHAGSTRARSVIRRIKQSGYVHAPTATQPLRYLKRSLPPLELDYTRATIDETVIDVEGTQNLPSGVDGDACQWVDLDGEGLSGAIAEQAGAWFYKRNVSALPVDRGGGAPTVKARFEALERVDPQPGLAGSGSRHQFLDLAGDGQVDVVDLDSPTPGYYERTDDAAWEPFVPFVSLPNLAWNDPNLRFVDLTGDGHADLLVTEDEVLVWYPSLGEDGFAPGERVFKAVDEEQGPRLVFADGTQSIYLADMSGDGLADLVRVRQHDVSYWPNLGYARWGKKVAMDNAPWFDTPGEFDQKRLRLADIDGSGTTDLIYLGADRIDIYRNQAGNRWSEPESLLSFPSIDNLSSVGALDLLGNGTACLVWSSPLAADATRPMRYIDLMGGEKPHLLVRSDNNLGAETVVRYAPSTRFYLQDRRDGRPWITKLPFPVQVVERVETYDRVSRNRFVTRYAYHHGHFDGAEREFRGFGLVEQFDTVELAALAGDPGAPSPANVNAASHVPPVLTRTWFHTGVYFGGERVTNFFAGLLDPNDQGEYYREPGFTDPQSRALLLEDTVLPNGLPLDEEAEACRALKGSMLRQEVYALDGTGTADYPYGHPYIVTEQNFGLVRLQGRGINRHAVFLVHPRETLSYNYERNPADPRVSHSLTLQLDEKYGQILKSLSVGYRRRAGLTPLLGADKDRQERTLVTYSESDFTKDVDKPLGDLAYDPDNYRAPLPCETRTYEITGFELAAGETRFAFDDFADNDCQVLRGLPEVGYETPVVHTAQRKRLIEQVRTLYRPDDMGIAVGDPLTLLTFGSLGKLALPGETYKLAFTAGLLDQVYMRAGVRLLPTNPDDVLVGGGGDHGGYVRLDGKWWLPSGRVFYSPDPSPDPLAAAADELTEARSHFFVPRRHRDAFHKPDGTWRTETFVDYDPYDLLVRETRDAVGNRITMGRRNLDDTLAAQGNDYRVLQPRLTMDPNRNCSEVAFDALGLVVGTAVQGKPEDSPAKGDQLNATFRADLPQAEVDSLYDAGDPHVVAPGLLGGATTRIVYDVDRFRRSRAANPIDPSRWQPVFAATLARETHLSEAPLTRILLSFVYSDGFGREIQKKIQAEPGRVPVRDTIGAILVGADGQPQMSSADAAVRWVGSGWTVFNNKGKVVRQFEPFFSDSHRPDVDVRIGVSPVQFYDPVERVVATLHPNATYEKVAFGAWHQVTWDVNDTVHLDPRTDPDVASHVASYFAAQPAGWQTWLEQRIDPASPPADSQGTDPEQDAAVRALAHAGTPTEAHFDSLGRSFFTIADNRAARYETRVALDIEGNQREVTDAKGRVVMRYDYDILGNRVRQSSMEAGERWMLNDAVGKPLRAWDSRGHNFDTTYDRLRRPLTQSVLGTNAVQSDPRTLAGPIVYAKTEYGEDQVGDIALNLRARTFRQYDGAGVVTNMVRDAGEVVGEGYDFKGNLLRGRRQTPFIYKGELLNWATALPGGDSFDSRTSYDALNRPVTLSAPDGSIVRPRYNAAGLLDGVDCNLHGAATPTAFVANVDYNAKGQRVAIDYATRDQAGASQPDRISTTYEYDPLTFRLVRLRTRRNAAVFDATDRPGEVQDLCYMYDPAGNITNVRDGARETVYFRNQRVQPVNDYVYDAIYRLVGATGREHLGRNSSGELTPWSYNDSSRIGVAHRADGNLLGTYSETYTYDEVGNFVTVNHSRSDPANPAWTRSYRYDENSLLESTKKSNRVTKTTVSGIDEVYSTSGAGYDAHGNMLGMPQLSLMQWDFQDRLLMTQRQKVDPDDEDGEAHKGERTFYAYDASGRRVRKVTLLANSDTIKDERTYVGSFDIYKSYGTSAVVRETLHIMDEKQRIALVETKTSGANAEPLIRYQFGNHLGTVCLELDDRAEVVSYEEYTPYGATTYQGVRQDLEVPAKRFRYVGKERDEESGLYFHGARYYVPWLGRWVACDPAGLGDGTDLYAYVQDNPVRYWDPTGKNTFLDLAQFIRNQSGFEQGALTPPTYQSSSGSPFGTAAHGNATSVIQQMEDIGFVNANRVVSEPVIVNGTIVSTGAGPAGAPKGALVPDLLFTNPGTTSQSVVGQAAGSVAQELGDLKYGGGVAATKYSQVGVPVRTVNGVTSSAATNPALVQMSAPQQGNLTGAAAEPVVAQTAASQQATVAATSTEAASTTSAATKAVASEAPATAGATAVGTGAKVLKVLGAAAGVAGSLVGGVQVGTGINQIAEGHTGEGVITASEGTANLGLTIGTAALVKAKVVSVGAAGGAAVVGAGLLAAGGIMLAAEEARRALRGEKTAAVGATEYYAGLVVEGEKEGGVGGALKQAGGWVGGFFSTLIAVGQGY